MKVIVVVFSVAVFGVVLNSCYSPHTSVLQEQENDLEIPQYFVCVRVHHSGSFGVAGSGVICEGGYLATAKHIFEVFKKQDLNKTSLEIQIPLPSSKNRKSRSYVFSSYNQFLYYDKEYDLVIIDLKKLLGQDFDWQIIETIELAELADADKVEVNENITIWGYVNNQPQKLTGKLISVYDNNNKIKFTPSVRKGFSGGPVINHQGKLLGISTHFYRFSDNSYGVSSKAIKNLINKINKSTSN